MHTRSHLLLGAAALAGLAISIGPAAAQTPQTEKLHVVARIGEVCTVTSASLDFGQGINLATNSDAQGSIAIDCAAQTTFGVQLDGGLNGGLSGLRQMANGASLMQYVLYKDAARSQVWLTSDQVPTTISGSGTVPVYGRVPIQSDGHVAGVYSDDVTITLIF